MEPAVGKERSGRRPLWVRELRGPLGKAGSAFQESSQFCSPPEKGSAIRGQHPRWWTEGRCRSLSGRWGVLSPLAEWLTQRQAHLGLMPCPLAAPPLHCPLPRGFNREIFH